ncbi:hypothetical protein DRW07_11365 [Alteromonas sediminis]|uniref:Flagellar biosynthesis protein FlgE n=1 Tax=Alteromonas sediminis TaxID=2259342 RepID=A0A3N5YML1_9ALTE|nr:hypothetical protein [Alteromonas sediminis]RPJ66671.1 hypothetical protein DRW07_11365 [Alteromonas sediminis]
MINTNFNVNSAIVSGQLGLQRASDGITQASLSIAQRTAQSTLEQQGPGAVLQQAAIRGLENTSRILPQAPDSLTSDLVSLQVNSINAQASAKVLEVANNTVGRIIDTLA